MPHGPFPDRVDGQPFPAAHMNAVQDALEATYTISEVDALVEAAGGVASLPYRYVPDFVLGGDGGDYSLALSRAIADLGGQPGEVVLPNRAEAYRTLVDIPSRTTIRGGGSQSEIVVDTNIGAAYRLLRAYGTVGTRTALTVDATANSFTVTLPTGAGAGWAVGDVVELRAENIIYGAVGKPGDVRKVIAVAGDVLTLDAPLLYDFTVANSATYAKVTPVVNICLRDVLVSNPDPSVNKGYLIDARRGVRTTVENVTIVDGGGGVLIADTMFPRVLNHQVDFQPNGWLINTSDTGLGYAVQFVGATSGGIVDHLQARHVRHAFTTLGSDGTPGYGGPRDCLISNGVSYQRTGTISGSSHWDTHEYGDNITFLNCRAAGGGEAGFQNRAKGTRYIGCWAYRVGLRGFDMGVTSSDAVIEGGGAVGCGGNGANLGGARSKLVDVDVRDNGSSGVAIAADDVLIQGCRIRNNTSYGVQYSSGANPVLRDNLIPQSAAQTIAALSLPSGAVAEGNIARGYANDRTAFYNANAGAVLRRNLTSSEGVAVYSASRTVEASEATLLMSAPSAAVTVTLPSAVGHMGRLITVKKTDASANGVVVAAAAAETIDGAATKTLGSQWATLGIMSTGAAWAIVSQMGTIT